MNKIRFATKRPVRIEYITYKDVVKMAKKDIQLNELNNYLRNTKITTCGNVWDLITNFDIQTLESQHFNFTDKDVLIIGVKKEAYPCKIDIFNDTYDN